MKSCGTKTHNKGVKKIISSESDQEQMARETKH